MSSFSELRPTIVRLVIILNQDHRTSRSDYYPMHQSIPQFALSNSGDHDHLKLRVQM